MLILIFLHNLFSSNKYVILPKGLRHSLQANVKTANRMGRLRCRAAALHLYAPVKGQFICVPVHIQVRCCRNRSQGWTFSHFWGVRWPTGDTDPCWKVKFAHNMGPLNGSPNFSPRNKVNVTSSDLSVSTGRRREIKCHSLRSKIKERRRRRGIWK